MAKEAAWSNASLSRRLPRICDGGEGQAVEFKREFPRQADDLAKSIAAFSTSNAGTVLLGITDSGKLVGMPELISAESRDVFARRIAGICEKAVRPRPEVRILYATSEGKVVAALAVQKGDQPVYWANERPYLRDQTSSRPMQPDDVIQAISRWLSRRGPPARPVPSAVRQRNDRKALKEFLSRFDTSAIDEFVERLKSDHMTWPGVLYYDAVTQLLVSPTFRLHNRKLGQAVQNFHTAWQKVMRHVEDFRETSLESVQRFVKPREMGSYPEWDKLHKVFRGRAAAFERAYVALLDIVHKQYPEIDLKQTSRRARAIRAYVESR